MHATPLLLRVSTALVLTVASVETLGPLLATHEGRTQCFTALADEATAPRGAFRSIAGELLIATDAMPDPTFAGTVLYVVSHDVDGAIALVLNRPIEPSLGVRAHDGGPVGRHTGFVLHSTDVVTPESIVLEDGVALTLDSSLLDAVRAGRGPREAVFLTGYAGWGPLQLDAEHASGVWRTMTADASQVFAATR